MHPLTDLDLEEMELSRTIDATRHQFGQPERIALIKRRNELRSTNIARATYCPVDLTNILEIETVAKASRISIGITYKHGAYVIETVVCFGKHCIIGETYAPDFDSALQSAKDMVEEHERST